MTSSARRDQPVSVPLNALTFDVEDYFHTEAMASVVNRSDWEQMPSRVCGNVWRLFEILAEHKVRATFFFLGWVAEKFPELAQNAARLGHEVACHSYWHRPVFSLTPEEFRADTLRAKNAIEHAAGIEVRGYRAPSFSIVPGVEWAFDILAELGFAYDSSVHPIRHGFYGNPRGCRLPYRTERAGILELPIATVRIGGNNLPVGGGAYFRLLPYGYSRWGLSRFAHDGPAVFYLHPWEIDPLQPRLPAGLKSRVRQYSGLSSVEIKFDRLLRHFRFSSIAQVFRHELEAVRGGNEVLALGSGVGPTLVRRAYSGSDN